MPCAPSSPSPVFSPKVVNKPGSKGEEQLVWVLGASGRQDLEVLSGMRGALVSQLHWSVPFAPVVFHLGFVVVYVLTPRPPYLHMVIPILSRQME